MSFYLWVDCNDVWARRPDWARRCTEPMGSRFVAAAAVADDDVVSAGACCKDGAAFE